MNVSVLPLRSIGRHSLVEVHRVPVQILADLQRVGLRRTQPAGLPAESLRLESSQLILPTRDYSGESYVVLLGVLHVLGIQVVLRSRTVLQKPPAARSLLDLDRQLQERVPSVQRAFHVQRVE